MGQLGDTCAHWEQIFSLVCDLKWQSSLEHLKSESEIMFQLILNPIMTPKLNITLPSKKNCNQFIVKRDIGVNQCYYSPHMCIYRYAHAYG